MKPDVGFTFTPDYTTPERGYFQTVSTDSRPEFDDPETFNIFDGGIFGSPSGAGRLASFTYGINNTVEAKIYSKRDSTTKNIKLLRTLRIGGSHNFALDSLRWSNVTFSGTTELVKGITNLNFNGSLTPYTVNEFNETVSLWSQNKRLLNLTNLSASIRTNLNARVIEALFKKEKQSSGRSNQPEQQNTNDIPFLNVFQNMGLSHNITFSLTELASGRDSFTIRTNSISVRGEIPLTAKWKLQVGSIGYDFNSKSITYPDLGFYRDLHCWELGADWQPRRGTYRFFIRVKPGSPLEFLELPYQKNNADAFGGF